VAHFVPSKASITNQELQIKNCKSGIANQELEIKTWKSRIGNQELQLRISNQELQSLGNCIVEIFFYRDF
jgi:hypothetical protein